MIHRLEQVAALVVAAGLALVSYWLFFSWARGGGAEHRLPGRARSSLTLPVQAQRIAAFSVLPLASEAAAGFEQPATAGAVLQAGQVFPHQLGRHRQPLLLADLHDA